MNKQIAIIGYGNQAKVWAQNFQDSGWQVTVLLRANSANRILVKDDGFVLDDISNLKSHATLALLISDHAMPDFFEHNLVAAGSKIIYAHGSTLLYHFEALPKSVSHLLLSPKMIADEVRACYLEAKPLPCILDVFHSHDKELDKERLIELAQALGSSTSSQMFYPVETEVQADFFSEQAILCGGVPKLLMQAVDTMTKNGIPKDLAYLECVKELEIFMRLFNQKGFYASMQNISPSAMYGGARYVQKHMPQEALQKSFDQCMTEIQNGNFYQSLQEASVQSKNKGIKSSENWKLSMQDSKLNALSEIYSKKTG